MAVRDSTSLVLATSLRILPMALGTVRMSTPPSIFSCFALNSCAKWSIRHTSKSSPPSASSHSMARGTNWPTLFLVEPLPVVYELNSYSAAQVLVAPMS